MNPDEFLRDVYRESGEQIRNNNAVRNAFFGFFAVAIAAFIGLLSRQEKTISSLIWFFPMLLSVGGFVNTLVFFHYTKRALTRQTSIAWFFLPKAVLMARGLENIFGERILRDNRVWCQKYFDPKVWKRNRIELSFFVTYFTFFATSVLFTVCGDPFGFTK